jgi:type I restriction enzyme S subunit
MEVKPGYKQTEVGVIPDEWEVNNLGAFVTYTNGKAHENSITDFGRFVVVNSKFISTEGEVRKYSNQSFCPALKDDVLMVMSDVPNGRAIAKCYLVERDEAYTVNQRICILRPHSINAKLLFYKLDRNPFYLAFDDGAKQTNLRKDDVLTCPLGIPKSNDEQRTIAGALSDVDALLGALDQLIAKKRDLKQAAMQQLLTGQTRLPGFHGEWDVETVAEIATISKGMQLHSSETNPDGHFPHFNGGISASSYTDKSNTPANTIAISEGGNSCGYVQFMLQPFWCGGHCYAVVPQEIDNQFLYHALKGEQTTIMGLRVGSGLPNIQKTALAAFKLNVPSERAEQTAIAEVLTDLDAELAALEQRRAKTRALKQGMMQELLTGRTAGMSNQKQTQGGQRPALDGSGGPDGFGAVAVNRAVR